MFSSDAVDADFRRNRKYGGGFNSFTNQDHGILRNAMGKLDEIEQLAVVLRFWENSSIQEISEILGLEWNEADQLLTKAFQKLKSQCLDSPGFSRALRKISNVSPAPLAGAA